MNAANIEVGAVFQAGDFSGGVPISLLWASDVDVV